MRQEGGDEASVTDRACGAVVPRSGTVRDDCSTGLLLIIRLLQRSGLGLRR